MPSDAAGALKPAADSWLNRATPAPPTGATGKATARRTVEDFDNDGDLDILIVNMNEPPSLLRNDLKGKHHWIKVKLVGVTSNRSAIGSIVLVHYDGKMQVQSVLSQSGFYSSSDPRLHFGLGSSATVDIEIFWTSGERSSLQKVSANRLVTIKEGIGIIPNLGWSKDDKS